eukprot:GCRY01004822.1.p1 GENE.GCRY01004822.1~~GCRY01004822.1.p1  ORF type:complete len:358 (-),score=65.00 GCRY01004822.1:131-1204(-)
MLTRPKPLSVEKDAKEKEDSPHAPSRKLLKMRSVGDIATAEQQYKFAKAQLLPSSASVRHALKTMRDYNQFDIPLFEPNDPNQNVTKMVNIVDVMTFVSFCGFRDSDGQTTHLVLDDSANCLSAPIGDVSGITKETSNLWECNENTPVYEIMEQLSKGVHAMLLHSKYGSQVISQMDILHFLCQNVEKLGALVNESISALGLTKMDRDIISLYENEQAIKGLRRLYQQEIHALPVLRREDGVVIGTLSATDICHIVDGENSDGMKWLLEPCVEFLRVIHHNALPANCVCTRNDSLIQVMTVLLAHKSHCVWIVDEGQRCTGVVTLSDIMSKFSPFDYKSVGLTTPRLVEAVGAKETY